MKFNRVVVVFVTTVHQQPAPSIHLSPACFLFAMLQSACAIIPSICIDMFGQ
jgi:hypothetical protein